MIVRRVSTKKQKTKNKTKQNKKQKKKLKTETENWNSEVTPAITRIRGWISSTRLIKYVLHKDKIYKKGMMLIE